jgi:hypothetical protein
MFGSFRKLLRPPPPSTTSQINDDVAFNIDAIPVPPLKWLLLSELSPDLLLSACVLKNALIAAPRLL